MNKNNNSNNYTNSNNNDNPKNDNININNNDHKKYENVYQVEWNIIIHYLISHHYYCWNLNVNVDAVGQYANKYELCIIVVKITPLHTHLNHLAEKCRVHVVRMILSS